MSSSTNPEGPGRSNPLSDDELANLYRQQIHRRAERDDERSRLRPTHSLDAAYWTSAARYSAASMRLYNVDLEICKAEHLRERDYNWWRSSEALRIKDAIYAVDKEKKIYEEQAARVGARSDISEAFQRLFNTSYIGIGADKAGMGARPRREQLAFKKALIQYYDANNRKLNNPKKPMGSKIYDSATGLWIMKELTRAAHILPYKFGPDLMKAFFADQSKIEVLEPFNGLLLHWKVKSAMDDGAIAVVPDMSLNPFHAEIALWSASDPKNYKWRIIDRDAECLENVLVEAGDFGLPENGPDLHIRDLDGKPVYFRNNNRPRARYLYFNLCVVVLKLAWKQENPADPEAVLKDQLGKGVWATLDKYMSRGFLHALAAEVGHDTAVFGDVEPEPAGILGISKMIQEQKARMSQTQDEEEDEPGGE